MGLLVIVALGGLVVLWLQHQQLVARVHELERAAGLREQTGAVLPTVSTQTPPLPAAVEKEPSPSPAAARAAPDRAGLVGPAPPPAPEGPRESSAVRLGGWFE